MQDELNDRESRCRHAFGNGCDRRHLAEDVEIIKEYDPKPKNPDGSVRRYLYRWDDGKDGVRRLARCRICGKVFLIQAYHLSKIADPSGTQYEDWYEIGGESEADLVNETLTGLQLELQYKPILRFAGIKPISGESGAEGNGP